MQRNELLKSHLPPALPNPADAPAQKQVAQCTSSATGKPLCLHLVPRTGSSEEERKCGCCISLIALKGNYSGQYSKSYISKLAQDKQETICGLI